MRVYNSGEEVIDEMKNQWNKNVRSMRIWGIIAAVLMMLIGVLCIVNPLETTYAIEVLASIALLCYGIWEIVRYTQKPWFLKTGVSLASGILNILLAIMLLSSPAEDMLLSFGFLFGLDLLMLGFEQVTATGRLHAIGVSETGYLTFGGILNIIAGIILLVMPMASVSAVSAVFAIYLIFGGINLLVTSINAKDLKAE